MTDRVICPTCETAFTLQRLGLGNGALDAAARVAIVLAVKCPVCHGEIHARVESIEEQQREWLTFWKTTPVRTTTITITKVL